MTDFDEAPHSDDFFVSDNPDKLDKTWVTNTLLGTYWGDKLTHEKIVESLRNSLCFGLYEHYLTSGGWQHKQVGFARVLTDHATFSWLCDVVIDPDYRKRGLGKFLVATVVNDPRIRSTVINLGTRDAQKLYEKFGFETVERMRKSHHETPTKTRPRTCTTFSSLRSSGVLHRRIRLRCSWGDCFGVLLANDCLCSLRFRGCHRLPRIMHLITRYPRTSSFAWWVWRLKFEIGGYHDSHDFGIGAMLYHNTRKIIGASFTIRLLTTTVFNIEFSHHAPPH